MREFAFELSLCAHLEADRDAVVARQLGAGVAAPGGRVLDVVLVEPGPAFEERAAITPHRIPDAIVDSDLAAGTARPVTDAIDASPERARSIAEHGAEIGVLELERRRGRLYARQTARYPEEWFGSIVGIENKPDLGTPGALRDQLRTDVSLGLVDRVVLATGSHVTGAHRNRIPDQVGIWRYHAASGDPGGGPPDNPDGGPSADAGRLEVLREAADLPTDRHGIELLERHPGSADVEVVSPAAKRRARRRIAERAYGKGWRTYAFPDCAEVEAGSVAGARTLPWCAWKGRLVDPASECGPGCDGYAAGEPPTVDGASERAARSAWVADPEGRQRRQSGLDRFE